MNETIPWSTDDLRAFVNFAHEGCINEISKAQKRILLLERFKEDAVCYPALHKFSASFHEGDLSPEVLKRRCVESIEEAKRVGLLCEKFNDKIFEALLQEFLKAQKGEKKAR